MKNISLRRLKSALLSAAAGAIILVALSGCSAEAKKARMIERAGKYFLAGDYEKAKIEYLNVLQLDPNYATAHERLGVMWFEQGSPLRAIPHLAKTRSLEVDNFTVREKLMEALVTIGKVSDARREALAILEKRARGEAILVVSATVRTKFDFDTTEKQIERFGDKNDALYHVAVSNLLLLKGDAPGATAALQRAKRTGSNSPKIHSALAAMHMRQNEPQKALEEFKLAADHSPALSIERVRYAEYLAQTGAAKEAADYLTDLIAKQPSFLTAKLVKARFLVTEKKYDEAEALIKDILNRDSAHVDALLLRTQMLAAKGETAKAIEQLTPMIKAFPGLAVINFNLARLHLAAQQQDKAIAVLTEGVASDPEHMESVLLLADLNIRSGKAEDAAKSLLVFLQGRPTVVQAQFLLVHALRAMGRLDDAASVLRDQLKAAPKNLQSHLLLGKVLSDQKKFDEARKSLDAAAEIAPGNVLVVGELVDLDINQKKFESALERARAQTLKSPTTAEGPFWEGKTHFVQKNWDKAEAALRKALEINPNFVSAYELLFYSLVSSGKSRQALTELEQTLAKEPKNAKALHLSAMIYGQSGEFEKAKDSYEKLLTIAPNSSIVLNNLACLYLDRFDRINEGYELAVKARQLEPESPTVADTLAWALYKRGDYDGAMTLLKDSAKKLPNNPEVQYHYGMVARKMGDNETARAALSKAANFQGDFQGKDAAKQELARIERGENDAPASAPPVKVGTAK